jgi:hypothetical protein
VCHAAVLRAAVCVRKDKPNPRCAVFKSRSRSRPPASSKNHNRPNKHQKTPNKQQVVIKGLAGPVTTFVVEPFVPHEDEYYLCIQTGR